jgi:hypothetical protein
MCSGLHHPLGCISRTSLTLAVVTWGKTCDFRVSSLQLICASAVVHNAVQQYGATAV